MQILEIFRIISLSIFLTLLSDTLGLFCELHAEDFRNLKGSRAFINLKPECEYLYPDVALEMMRSGKLLNDYLYGDERHPATKLIQMAFNIPPGAENSESFRVSLFARNFAKFISPSAAGKLISHIDRDKSELKEMILSDEGFVARKAQADFEKRRAQEDFDLYRSRSPEAEKVNEMTEKVEGLNEKCRSTLKKRLTSLQGALKDYLENASKEEKKETLEDLKIQAKVGCGLLANKLENAKKDLKDAKEVLKSKGEALESKIVRVSYQVKYLDSFLDALKASVHAERDPTDGGIRYPVHTTEQIVLAIGWMNTGNDKSDLLSLYQSMAEGNPSCFTHKGIRNLTSQEPSDQERRHRWIQEKYTESDYSDTLNRAGHSPEERASYFQMHPEDFALATYSSSFFDSFALPLFHSRRISFKHPQSGTIVSMADCMEASILNVIWIPLGLGRERNRLDVTYLEEKLRSQGYALHPGFKSFLETYSVPIEADGNLAHAAWAELISGIPGVENFPRSLTYEIEPTLSNALKVFEYLFYSHPIQDHTRTAPLYTTLTLDQKFNQICDLLSRIGVKVTWKLRDKSKDENNGANSKYTNLIIAFSINGIERYYWKMTPGHAEVGLNFSSSSEKGTELGKELARRWVDNRKINPRDQILLNWLARSSDTSAVLESLKTLNGDPGVLDFVLRMPISTEEDKLRVMEALISLSRSQGDLGGEIKLLIENLLRKLPDNLRVQRRYHAALANADYPFMPNSIVVGSDPNSLYIQGKPHAVYTRVSELELAEKFGEHAVAQMGRTWKRRIHGREIAIGEPLINADGTERLLTFAAAQNACLDLNSIENRNEVEKNQIYGCHLISEEEWEVIRSDFGFDDQRSQFIPQILPKVNDREFWISSSRSSRDVLTISGSTGNISPTIRYIPNSVRCACSSRVW